MAETMIDRMARADAEFCNRDFDALGAADKRRFRDRAAFILEAMPEPTEAMSVNGGLALEEALFGGDDDLIFDVAAKCYSAMIAAPLIAQDKGAE